MKKALMASGLTSLVSMLCLIGYLTAVFGSFKQGQPIHITQFTENLGSVYGLAAILASVSFVVFVLLAIWMLANMVFIKKESKV